MNAWPVPGRRRPAASPGRGERCPACPFRGLTGAEAVCPSCGTDLTVLRAVQRLPDNLLADGLALARAGDLAAAAEVLAAAAAFDRTRAAATALLRGWRDTCPHLGCALHGRVGRGNVRLVGAGGLAPGAAGGLPPESAVEELDPAGAGPLAGAPAGPLAGPPAGPPGRCAPLWRCAACGRTFEGRRAGAVVGSRHPRHPRHPRRTRG